MVFLNPTSQEASKGPILALMKLLEVRKKMGIQDISFGAGLPDHEVHESIRKKLIEAANALVARYSKYDIESPFNENNLKEPMADFHNKTFPGAHFTREDMAFSPGSTPVLAATAYVTQNVNSTTLAIHPTYPLIKLPVERQASKVNCTARMIPGRSGRWQLDYDSIEQSLRENRDKATMLYLNFPSNPTGYAPTEVEYKHLVKLLLNDISARKIRGKKTMTILEDIAYATMMHDGKKYYSLHQCIEDLRKEATEENNSGQLQLLNEIEQSVVVAHSFSKAFGLAGHRVAYYASKNHELLAAINNQIIDMVLTPDYVGLAGMAGACEIGHVNEVSMKEYETRLRYFENGVNRVMTRWLASPGNGAAHQGSSDYISQYKPVPAKADAGFFSTTFFNALKGQHVEQHVIDSLKSQAAQIVDEDLRKLFDGIFCNNTINTPLDAACWLAATTNVICIPLTAQGNNDLPLRWSVGNTPVPTIDTTLERLEKALKTLPPPAYTKPLQAAMAV